MNAVLLFICMLAGCAAGWFIGLAAAFHQACLDAAPALKAALAFLALLVITLVLLLIVRATGSSA